MMTEREMRQEVRATVTLTFDADARAPLADLWLAIGGCVDLLKGRTASGLVECVAWEAVDLKEEGEIYSGAPQGEA